jgi:hypothetical protein
MKKCFECGKEIKIFSGYYHPILGKNKIVCSNCYNILEESLNNYRDFILKNYENEEKNIINNKKIKIKHMIHNYLIIALTPNCKYQKATKYNPLQNNLFLL